MDLFLNVLWLIVGFVLLIKGADFFVDGASSLARKLKVPSLIVGLTIVAIGTSAPELAVSITSSLNGANSLSVSNVMGSNIFNVLVVLGMCALVKPLAVTADVLKRDFLVVIGVSMLLLCLIFYLNNISRGAAVILLCLTDAYMIMTVTSALKNRENIVEEDISDFRLWKVSAFMICGAAAIVFGGNLVVDSASAIGFAVGMSETMVGLTICAVGTSLPELVTSLIATKKGQTDMAIGNVVGSNIFNIILILGLSGVISPIILDASIHFNSIIDACVTLFAVVIGFIFCITSKKIVRWEGSMMLLCYAGYMVYAILRS